MSIAEPIVDGAPPFSPESLKPEARAAFEKWANNHVPPPAHLAAQWDEAISRDMDNRRRADWKRRLAEAAATKKKGPPAPFPRVADESDGAEYWACPLDHHLSRESAVVDALNVKRETDYVEHCMNTAGFIMDDVPYQKSLRRRFVRFDQSIKLAMALVEGGARKPESRKNAPSILTYVSRREIKLPIIPRVNFLPETAAARRSPMLKEVENYAHRNPLARMATFTAGQRVALSGIRARTMELTRKISRLNSEKWFKPNAEIPFRAIEYGTFKLSAQTGEHTAHTHAHCILKPRRFMKPKKWAKFCRKVSAFMGAHWDGGRPIENAREMVKYPVKPADLEHLLEIGGIEPICEFYRQTLGLRLVETLGSLRAQRQSRKNTKRKRVKERNADGDWLPAMRRNWNSQGRSVTKAATRAKRQRKAAAERFREGMDGLNGFCQLPPEPAAAPKMVNRIVARLGSGPYASPVYEPAAFVWNFDGNWDAILSHPCVQRCAEAVRPQVESALAKVAAAQRRAATAAHNSPHQSHNCPNPILEFPPPDPFRKHMEALST